jgi:hypothetical protein
MADGDDAGSEDYAALLERLVVAHEEYAESQSKPTPRWERFLTPAAVAVSAIGVALTIWQVNVQQDTAADQFDRTMRQSQYSDIVSGMASSSVGVQVNSIRSLVQHVRDPANYDDDDPDSDLQEQAAVNAAQTLTSFIEDESTVPDHEGLTDYRDPQPVVVARALDQLVELTGSKESDPGAEEVEFPHVAVDISRGNFHGVYAPDFAPQSNFRAVGADFRNATVTGWDLSDAQSPDLSSAFLTCADLQASDLGTAEVAAADFTGANLRGADLSEVQDLTSDQLTGALVGPETRLPAGVEAPLQPGWGVENDGDHFSASPACRFLVDRMTNLVAGSGYSSRLPCAGRSQWPILLESSERAALDRVCRLRSRLPDRQPSGR